MTLIQGDTLTQISFSVFENKGVFAVLLGSGLSRAAEIPTGWEITLDLVRRVALAQGVGDQTDWAKWYLDTVGKEPNYSDLLEEIASTPDERRSILHSYIEPTLEEREQGKKVPTSAHRAIAALVRLGFIRVIITTNFDRLMENALREIGVEPTLVASEDALRGAEPLIHSACYLVKLHGDYKDARILNTNSELSSYPAAYDRMLDRIFDEHGLIVCGWSGDWDHALRAAILRAPNRRYPMYWALRGDAGQGAQELIDHRRAKPVAITGADAFFEGLQQRVDTLMQNHRQNPSSMELLVNTTKRFLSKSEYRIQLDDLVSQELNDAIAKLDLANLHTGTQWSGQELQRRAQIYEALSEPLCRVASVLGRWGTGVELRTVVDIVRAFYSHAEANGSGLSIWLNMRSYPAVLVFTAYGLGLLRGQRFKDLHGFLTSALGRSDAQVSRMVDSLLLAAWKGGDASVWRNLPGLDSRKTPLSDHLFDVMDSHKNSYVGVVSDFELLFERFETLAALAYFEKYVEVDLEKKSLENLSSDAIEWMPVGRIGWHAQSGRSIVSELEANDFASSLLEAGFAKGSRRFLEIFITNLNRYQSRMFW